jgi:AmiR/NasT family two-component response regulator
MVSRPEMARHAAEIAQLHARIDQLETALVSRATIDQAKGMLMAFAGWAADEAFAELAGVSQDTNVKLALIAGRLVDDVTARRVARRDQQSVRQILRALAAEVDGN